jgi:hypothetical protein
MHVALHIANGLALSRCERALQAIKKRTISRAQRSGCNAVVDRSAWLPHWHYLVR